MVAITKPFSLALSIVLMGTTAFGANTTPPEHTPQEMARVVDCQTQCVEISPSPFGNPPSIHVRKFLRVNDYGRLPYLVKNMQPVVEPCLKHVRELHSDDSQITEEKFLEYVLCNSKTLTKNEDRYFAADFDYKANGFNETEWIQFRNHTVPGFRRALHRCRGGCRRIHFAHKTI